MTRREWYKSSQMGREEFWREVDANAWKALPLVGFVVWCWCAIRNGG